MRKWCHLLPITGFVPCNYGQPSPIAFPSRLGCFNPVTQRSRKAPVIINPW